MTKEFDARNENKSRSVCAAMAEAADTGKRALSERERRILDMWPRFEDTGDPVMVGDAYIDGSGDCSIIVAVRICDVCVDLVGEDGFLTGFKPGERVKRPAPEVLDADGVEIKVGDTVYELETGEEYKVERVFSGATDPDFPDHTIRCNKVADPITHVFKPDQLTHRHIVLDADGVEIKVGDTVWHEDGSELHVIGFGDAQDGETMLAVEYAAGPTKWGEVRCLSVTHTRPAPKVLDADGVEIHVGDTVYGVGRSQHSFDVIDPHHIDPEVGEAFSVRCYDRDEGEECHCRPELLTHTRPDSWERLEEDAVKVVCEYAGAVPDEFGDYDCDTCRLFDARGKLICEQQMALNIVRRAKAIAGVEVDG